MTAQDKATVFVDADNTLWDTDRVFADAQHGLLGGVEEARSTTAPAGDRLAYVRAVDQAIAAKHHAGLRYPPKLLITALADVLDGRPVERAARSALTGSNEAMFLDAEIAAIESRYFEGLGKLPALRPGVETGLDRLTRAGATILIVTEGARQKVERTALRLGLDGRFSRVVEGVKRPDLYRRVLRLTGLPKRAFMIGDQLDRDIAPAKLAGLETIYFPGGFQPRWHPGIDSAAPDHTIGNFAEVPAIVHNAVAEPAAIAVR